jgi:hypothetical protein
MVEDPVKVNNQVGLLNRLTPGQTWVPLIGFNALTTCYFSTTGQLMFNPNYGFPVKAFLNQVTGEVRMFNAKLFYA